MNNFSKNKKTLIGVVITAVIVIGGIIGGISYHNTQVAKQKAETEKKAKAHLEKLTKEFDTAKFRIENAILEETERATLLESLNGYEKKLDGISKEDEKEFDTLCTSIEEKYTASAVTLDNAVAGIGSAYPSEEGYYTEEFTASVTALMDELNTLKADGKYQEAYNKYNEINNAYMAYVEQVNAQRAAAEEAAKKAEQEKAKAESNKKSSTSTAKNGSKGGSNNGSGSGSASGGNSSSEDRSYPSGYNSYEEYQETLAAKAQANAQGSPVRLSNGMYVTPSDWSVDQKLNWMHENCN